MVTSQARSRPGHGVVTAAGYRCALGICSSWGGGRRAPGATGRRAVRGRGRRQGGAGVVGRRRRRARRRGAGRLPAAGPALTAEQAGGLLIHLCPDERFTTDELLAEGFALAKAAPAEPPAKKRRRWLPIGAAALIGALAVGSIVAALTSGGSAPAAP